MPALLEKGSRLSDYLIFLLQDLNRQAERKVVHILTPSNPKEKGCQVSISVPNAGPQVFDAIVQHGVFADWREPDVIRVAPVPLYNSFSEVWQFARIVEKILIGE
jgi:kynureninase